MFFDLNTLQKAHHKPTHTPLTVLLHALSPGKLLSGLSGHVAWSYWSEAAVFIHILDEKKQTSRKLISLKFTLRFSVYILCVFIDRLQTPCQTASWLDARKHH